MKASWNGRHCGRVHVFRLHALDAPPRAGASAIAIASFMIAKALAHGGSDFRRAMPAAIRPHAVSMSSSSVRASLDVGAAQDVASRRSCSPRQSAYCRGRSSSAEAISASPWLRAPRQAPPFRACDIPDLARRDLLDLLLRHRVSPDPGHRKSVTRLVESLIPAARNVASDRVVADVAVVQVGEPQIGIGRRHRSKSRDAEGIRSSREARCAPGTHRQDRCKGLVLACGG